MQDSPEIKQAQGKTLAEYALILFLVVLVSIPALQILGNAISDLLAEGNAPSKAGQLFGLLGGNGGGNGIAPTTSGLNPYEALSPAVYTDAQGNPIVVIDRQEADATGLVATSTNGTVSTGEVGAFSSFKLANSLEELAQQAEDPDTKAWLEKLAYYSYYLGNAEGELDDVPGLDLTPKNTADGSDYSNKHALEDLLSLSGQLKTALANPPAGIDPQELALATTLGTEVYDISQQYKTALSQFIDENGNVTQNWGNAPCKTSGTCASGGYSGLALEPQTYDTSYTREDLNMKSSITDPNKGSYEQFKQKANTLLDEGAINSEPVKITLTDAREIDETASQTSRWGGRSRSR